MERALIKDAVVVLFDKNEIPFKYSNIVRARNRAEHNRYWDDNPNYTECPLTLDTQNDEETGICKICREKHALTAKAELLKQWPYMQFPINPFETLKDLMKKA